MANGHFSGERKEISFAEDLGHEPHLGVDLNGLAARGGYARAFLPTVLEGEEPEEGEAARGLLGGIYSDYPALFAGAVERAIVLV
jgi:hypothetical protein